MGNGSCVGNPHKTGWTRTLRKTCYSYKVLLSNRASDLLFFRVTRCLFGPAAPGQTTGSHIITHYPEGFRDRASEMLDCLSMLLLLHLPRLTG